VRLYELARRGETVERRPVEVEIKRLELCAWPQDPRHGAAPPAVPPPVLLRENADGTRECDVCVRCSSGTYVRTLAEDIGRRLGVGAHLTRLRRTRAGRCSIASAVTLEELAERVAAGEVSRVLTPMSAALDLPEVAVGAAERKLLAQGRPLAARRRFGDGEQVKLTDGDALLAIARYHSETRSLRPHVVLAPNSQPPAT
jgi:tRNA pseudouridine55 synthase